VKRLLTENLHGAVSPFTRPSGGPGRARQSGEGADEDSWILIQEEPQDMDAKDPR
jgi:hypothetical protein